jgi:hypothetical protein
MLSAGQPCSAKRRMVFEAIAFVKIIYYYHRFSFFNCHFKIILYFIIPILFIFYFLEDMTIEMDGHDSCVRVWGT